MAHWQRRARLGIAIFGIVFAIAVYAAMGERETATPAPRPERFDPAAILESAGAAFQQFRDARQDYVIEAERQLTYEGGATKFLGVTVKVRGRSGRDFVVTGREAQAGGDRQDLEIAGDVTLTASDGLVLSVERAEFSESDATVRTAGPVSFRKGGMQGSGVGMSYDRDSDVLSIADQAQVEVAGEDGSVTASFTAGSATLARLDDYLALEGDVHALRGEQVLQADRGVARLTPDEERITSIELRGNARVSGGNAFDSLRARDINLDYADDGESLEQVALSGEGEIAMLGRDGAPGRRFLGDALDLRFAPDGSLLAVTGQRQVRLDLPSAAGGASRSVRAEAVDATGEPGGDLTAAEFTGDVEYVEKDGGTARIARARALQIALAGDEVTDATFTGDVWFEEAGLQASAATADYDPVKGTLRLSGAGTAEGPRVTDEQIAIEAASIDVALEGRRMSARGTVKTVLQSRAAGGQTNARLPGLLQQGEPANVNADRLEYEGSAGRAVYTGGATLWQGETAVRADAITIDRSTGDLTGAGNARSTLTIDGGLSVGQAQTIAYDDRARRLRYDSPAPIPNRAPTGRGVDPNVVLTDEASAVSGAPPRMNGRASSAPAAGAGGAVAPARAPQAQLNGPHGNLQASRIDVLLASDSSEVERLEAHSGVEVRLDTRVATGDRLTYHAEDARYVMSGVATLPVRVVEGCRETTGRTVTFFKSSDRIIVDGNEEVRTQSRRGATPCPAAPAR